MAFTVSKRGEVTMNLVEKLIQTLIKIVAKSSCITFRCLDLKSCRPSASGCGKLIKWRKNIWMQTFARNGFLLLFKSWEMKEILSSSFGSMAWMLEAPFKGLLA